MASNNHSSLRISSLVLPEAIELSLRGSQRDQVLRELVSRVPALRDQPTEQERLLQALIEREEMHSTGIGDGLALPHTRNTLGGLVQQPLIVMGRHPDGVPYGAIDGKPVQLFFLLLTTSVTEHLHILARMSRLLRDSKLRQGLLTAPTPTAVVVLIQATEG